MKRAVNSGCLQKPKPQTPQFIPDKPYIGTFRVRGKVVDEQGKVKQYSMRPKERVEVFSFLNQEDCEYYRKMTSQF